MRGLCAESCSVATRASLEEDGGEHFRHREAGVDRTCEDSARDWSGLGASGEWLLGCKWISETFLPDSEAPLLPTKSRSMSPMRQSGHMPFPFLVQPQRGKCS